MVDWTVNSQGTATATEERTQRETETVIENIVTLDRKTPVQKKLIDFGYRDSDGDPFQIIVQRPTSE